jgi:hypothetical protein
MAEVGSRIKLDGMFDTMFDRFEEIFEYIRDHSRFKGSDSHESHTPCITTSCDRWVERTVPAFFFETVLNFFQQKSNRRMWNLVGAPAM